MYLVPCSMLCLQQSMRAMVDLLRCTLCQEQLDDNLYLAYHLASVIHLKNLRAYLSTVGFGGCCLVCDFNFCDPKTAIAHVKAAGHKHKVVHGSKATCSKSNNYICSPCFLEFNDIVGWEVHLANCPHSIPGLALHLPKLNAYLGQLSGSSLDKLSLKLEPFCSLCDEKFEGLADFMFHFITAKHIELLTKSSCHVCKKEFFQILDLEKHLSTSTHSDNIESYIRDPHPKNACALQFQPGYTCQPCLICCKSWQCFKLHVMDHGHHVNISKRDKIIAHSRPPTGQNLNRFRQPLTCSSKALVDLNVWKEQPMNLSAWCYSCSRVLASPEETELHLSKSCPQKVDDGEVVSDAGVPLPLENGTNTEIFHCEACSVSFRSPIALAVHEAFEQHGLRSIVFSNSKTFVSLQDTGHNVSCTPDKSAKVLEASKADGALSQSTCPDTVHNSGDEVPVVVATATLPSQSVQASLQSIIDVVLDTLSASLPGSTHPPVPLPQQKRQRDHTSSIESDKKRPKIGETQQAAVVEGLSSFPSDKDILKKCSYDDTISCDIDSQARISCQCIAPQQAYHVNHGTSMAHLSDQGIIINTEDSHNSENVYPVMVSRGQRDGVTIVVAAAVIPLTNSSHAATTSKLGDALKNQACKFDPGKSSISSSRKSQEADTPEFMTYSGEAIHKTESHSRSPSNSPVSNAESDDDIGDLGAFQARIFCELDLP